MLSAGQIWCSNCGLTRKGSKNIWQKTRISPYWKGRLVDYFSLGVPAYRLRFQVPYSKPTILRWFSTETASLNLLDLIVGYSKLIIVDSIQVSSNNELGHIFKLEVNQLNPSNGHFNSHDIDFSKLFKIGKKLGTKLPRKIKIYRIDIFFVKGFE